MAKMEVYISLLKQKAGEGGCVWWEWTGKQPRTLTNMCMYRYLPLILVFLVCFFFYHCITAVKWGISNWGSPGEARMKFLFQRSSDSFCVVASVLCCPWTPKYPHWRCSGGMSHHSGLYHPFGLCRVRATAVSPQHGGVGFMSEKNVVWGTPAVSMQNASPTGLLVSKAFEVTFSPSVGLELWSTAGKKSFWTGAVLYCVLMTFKY